MSHFQRVSITQQNGRGKWHELREALVDAAKSNEGIRIPDDIDIIRARNAGSIYFNLRGIRPNWSLRSDMAARTLWLTKRKVQE